MRELCRAMTTGDARGLVGLTFDDAYEIFLSTALPTLETLGFSATVFVVAGMLGEENTWEHRGDPVSRLRLLEADGVREVSERGMEVGSHSVTHPRLSGLERETLTYEVGDSRQMLSEILNAPVEGFCYPYGNVDGPAVPGCAWGRVRLRRCYEETSRRRPLRLARTYVGEKDSLLRLGVKLR